MSRVARERIAAALPLDESAMAVMPSRKSTPRVPFGALVETGLIAPGAVLIDAKRRWTAQCPRRQLAGVRGAHAGSIHKLGAELQGAPSCNGWTFWHVETRGAAGADRRAAPGLYREAAGGMIPGEIARRGRSAQIYLRPTGFIDAPFGYDGQTLRLAGGLIWFSMVEVIAADARRSLLHRAGAGRADRGFRQQPARTAADLCAGCPRPAHRAARAAHARGARDPARPAAGRWRSST